MTAQTTEFHIKLYEMRVHYHTAEIVDYKVYAADLNQAHAIAATQFRDTHTEKCIFDSVQENPTGKQLKNWEKAKEKQKWWQK